VKMRLAESDVPSAWVFWVGRNSNEAKGIRSVKPTSPGKTLIVGAKSFRPWSQQMSWRGPIDSVGIRVPSGTVSVSEIVLADSLTRGMDEIFCG